MKKQLWYIVMICILLFAGCEDDEPPYEPINIIVILDVSDRLQKEGQIDRDKKIVETIINHYESFIKKQRYSNYFDRLTFAIPTQPGIKKEHQIPQKIKESLRIHPKGTERAPQFRKMRDELINSIDFLYKFVEERNLFTGSDIWGWFDVSAEGALQSDFHNYIICISDGYLYLNKAYVSSLPKEGNKYPVMLVPVVEKFQQASDWEDVENMFENEGHGFLPIDKKFNNYNPKFLMVEIGRPVLPALMLRDVKIIKKYWVPWLQKMGISEVKFLQIQSELPSVRKDIEEFISPPKKLPAGE